jgi:hypothetical protein
MIAYITSHHITSLSLAVQAVSTNVLKVEAKKQDRGEYVEQHTPPKEKYNT